MNVLIADADFNRTNIRLSVDSITGQRYNFSYYGEFTTKVEDKVLGTGFKDPKSHIRTIFLPIPMDEIKLLRIYSNSGSLSTFKLLMVRLVPIYYENELERFLFSKVLLLDNPSIDMKHNTWYNLRQYG